MGLVNGCCRYSVGPRGSDASEIGISQLDGRVRGTASHEMVSTIKNEKIIVHVKKKEISIVSNIFIIGLCKECRLDIVIV